MDLEKRSGTDTTILVTEFNFRILTLTFTPLWPTIPTLLYSTLPLHWCNPILIHVLNHWLIYHYIYVNIFQPFYFYNLIFWFIFIFFFVHIYLFYILLLYFYFFCFTLYYRFVVSTPYPNSVHRICLMTNEISHVIHSFNSS